MKYLKRNSKVDSSLDWFIGSHLKHAMYNVKIDTDPYDTQPVQQPVKTNHVVPTNDHGNANHEHQQASFEMVRLLNN